MDCPRFGATFQQYHQRPLTLASSMCSFLGLQTFMILSTDNHKMAASPGIIFLYQHSKKKGKDGWIRKEKACQQLETDFSLWHITRDNWQKSLEFPQLIQTNCGSSSRAVYQFPIADVAKCHTLRA